MNSSIRLLVAFRDPVERAISGYLQVLPPVFGISICFINFMPRYTSMMSPITVEHYRSIFVRVIDVNFIIKAGA